MLVTIETGTTHAYILYYKHLGNVKQMLAQMSYKHDETQDLSLGPAVELNEKKTHARL